MDLHTTSPPMPPPVRPRIGGLAVAWTMAAGVFSGTIYGTLVFPIYGTMAGTAFGAAAGVVIGLVLAPILAVALRPARSIRSAAARAMWAGALVGTLVPLNIITAVLVLFGWAEYLVVAADAADFFFLSIFVGAALPAGVGTAWAALEALKSAAGPATRAAVERGEAGGVVRILHVILASLLPLAGWLLVLAIQPF